MIVVAWHPVSLFHLSLGQQDRLPDLIKKFKEKATLPDNADPSSIRAFFHQNPKAVAELGFLRRYVPTRFLSPWMENELRGAKDNLKESKIISGAGFSQKSRIPTPYYFNQDQIIWNLSCKEFISDNLGIIDAFSKYHFTLYLQGRNPHVPGIIHKLSTPPL